MAGESDDSAKKSADSHATFGPLTRKSTELSRDSAVPTAVASTAIASITSGQAPNFAQISAVITPFSFPPEWESARQDAIRLLSDLPSLIREAENGIRLIKVQQQSGTSRGGIGHNREPDWDTLISRAEDAITDASVAGDVLLSELKSEQPRLAVIRLADRTLRRVLDLILDLAAKFAEGAVEALGGYVALNYGGSILEHLRPLEISISQIVTKCEHLFSLLGMIL